MENESFATAEKIGILLIANNEQTIGLRRVVRDGELDGRHFVINR